MSQFPAVRIEGGLLGPDTLEKLVAGELPGQKPKDFGLDGRRSMTDEIASVFADARTQWEVFQRRLERLPDSDPATSITRDAWLIPFLSLLGYELRYNVRAYEIDGATFAISHRAGEAEDAPPVHLVGARQELGRLAPGSRSRLAPHSLVQEYLNRTDHLWGLVTNGLVVRLLRNSTFVRRQAYVEFDLRQILEEQRFGDFAVLYRLLHRTRLPRTAEDAPDCLLEQYYRDAIEQGGRVREGLRAGVEACIKHLANGFLAHPANAGLRGGVASGDFYRQLLRLVYRLLFLLVSEDRGLIGDSPLYREHYGVARLRRLLDRHSAYTDHEDIWCSLKVLWKVLSDDNLAACLGMSPLNGALFEPLDLDQCSISNRDFLEAFWHLAYYREEPSAPPRRVNYAALDVEELGSVYESLLDYHPQIDTSGRVPRFELASGSERKSTGSYYTPPELVAELIRSALEPVLEERLAEARRMADELQRVANGEWRVVRQMIIERFGERHGNSILSRLGSLAESDAPGRTGVSAHRELPARGTVRADEPDAAGSSLGSGKHRGGVGPAGNEGVSSFSQHRGGQPERAGNLHSAGTAGGTGDSGDNPADTGLDSGTQQTDGESSAQSQEELVPHSPPAPEPLATRHSPLAQALAEHTLLSLRVLDPACGSGHFLLAAARRLGKELAKIRTGKDEPDPDHVREAIRDVVSRCIYGVDKNPLAVELCRVALWLEAHCVGKPLTFLDHHIKCGDSLVGVLDLAVLERGIPDEAFAPVSADDKSAAAALKKQNKKERHDLETRQGQLPFDPTDMLAGLREQRQQIEAIADDSPADVRRKKSLYDDYDRDPQRRKLAEACHLWTAAFFQRLKPGAAPSAITTQVITDHLADRRHPQAVAIAEALAVEQHFFHWPLEFPEVFGGMASSEWRVASGGEASGEWRVASSNSPLATRDSLLAAFDVVLSNPPWERIKLQEEEFFAGRDARIAQAPNAAARKRLIAGLPVTNPDLWDAYQRALHRAESASRFLRGSRQYPLTGRGDINTYSVFAERIRCLLSSAGRAGIILPTGIATDDTNKSFFADLVEKGHLVSLFDFENREAIFPAVHRSYKFCLLTLTGGSEEVGSEQGASSERRVASSEQGASSEQRVASEASSEQRVASSDQPLATRHSPLAPSATFAFFATRAEHLRDPRRVFSLTAADIARINPNTRTLPVFRTRQDADLTRAIYERVPVLVNEREAGDEKGEAANPWGVRFLAMFHMSNDSHLFRTRAELEKEGYRLVGNRFVKEASGEQRVASCKEASGERRVASSNSPLATRDSLLANSATRHSSLANTYLPLYEAKMIWHYDHRYGTYEGADSRSGTQLPTPDGRQHADPQFVVQPWYWVPAEEVAARLGDWQRGWLLGFRDVTNATNERTAIFSLLPRVGAGHKVPLIFSESQSSLLIAAWLANFSSLVLDFVTRQKIGGTSLGLFILRQLPVLPPAAYTPEDLRFIVPRVLELTYTAWDMQPFADDVWQEADEALRAAIRTQWEANRREANGEWRVASGREASSEQRVASSEQGASSEQRVASSEQGASSERRVASCKEASGERRVASCNSPLATRDSLLANSGESLFATRQFRHSPLTTRL